MIIHHIVSYQLYKRLNVYKCVAIVPDILALLPISKQSDIDDYDVQNYVFNASFQFVFVTSWSTS